MMLEKDEFLKRLGNEICARRKCLGISQNELAEKADLSLTYISKIECGHKNISAYTLARITEMLNVPSSEIVAKACGDETSIIREAKEDALTNLPVQKQRDVVEILNIISRLTTK